MKRLLAVAAACLFTLSLLAAPVSAVPPVEDCSGSQGGATPPEWDCDVVNSDEIDNPPFPTTARHFQTRCRDHHRSNAQGQNEQRRTICLTINNRDISAPSYTVESLLEFDIADGYHADAVQIYINWIRLINAANGNVLKFKNDIGWFTCQPGDCDPDAYGTSHDTWFHLCNAVDTDGKARVYGKARYRFKWLGLAGDPVGDYKLIQTGTMSRACGP